MTAMNDLIQAIAQGQDSPLMGDREAARNRLEAAYGERYHQGAHAVGPRKDGREPRSYWRMPARGRS
jgi:hypothetical protein